MAVEVTMPVLGLTMEEGTVAEWLKREGDTVAKDEPLLLVEMDKGTVEVPAPAAGVLERIVVPTGVTVPVKTLIAEIGTSAPSGGTTPDARSPGSGALHGDAVLRDDVGETAASSRGADASALAGGVGETAGNAGAIGDGGAGASGSGAGSDDGDLSPEARGVASIAGTASAGSSANAADERGERDERRQFVTPRARLRARELGVELTELRGSGPHGRVVEADVLAAVTVETRQVFATAPASAVESTLAPVAGVAAADARTAATSLPSAPAATSVGAGPVGDQAGGSAAAPVGQVETMSRLRRLTAERMLASAQATARVTLFLDADFSEASRFRQQLQPEFARLGVEKLPWDAVIARAAALALVEHPAMRRQWVDSARLLQPEAVNIGVAVALEPEGLVVPVLRNADSRSLRELAADLTALADKARANRLDAADMRGGTFTITNLGAYRVDGFTPILNPPETAILGVGRVADRAIVVDGRVEVRSMCTLSLSFDHRVVDGAPAAAFLARLAELLERPYALLGI